MISNQQDIESGHTTCITWSMARLPKEGEEECGDYPLVKQYEDKVLVAAIDGLGHGASAARASRRTRQLLETFSSESLINLVNQSHSELRHTRGVVMSMALIDPLESMMTWIGVGNVEGVLLRANPDTKHTLERIVLRAGVVGYKLPSLQASVIPLEVGDMLIFTTDGVENDYIEKVKVNSDTEDVVEYIASNFFKASDDALIIAVRYNGEDHHEDQN